MIVSTRRIASPSSWLAVGLSWMILLSSAAACRSNEAEVDRATTAAASSAAAATHEPSAIASASGPDGRSPAPGKPLTDDGRMQIGPDDRCPVCAMKVAEHTKFASALQLRDGRTYYFCGTGCMLRTWLHPEVFLASSRTELRRGVAPDYFTGKHRDAAEVTWIAGSDVVGPMGPAIVPIGDDANVAEFKKRHGGKHTFELAELTDALWEKITGKKAGR